MIDHDLPLIELHRHLEGSIRPQTILELGEKHGRPVAGDLEGVMSLVQVTEPQPDLVSYLLRNDRAVSILADLDACSRVAYECVEDASREGLDYLELRFSPLFMAMPWKLDIIEVVDAVADGAIHGADDDDGWRHVLSFRDGQGLAGAGMHDVRRHRLLTPGATMITAQKV